MYLEHSPYNSPYPGLRKTDLIVFGNALEEIILSTIPTSKKITLVSKENLTTIKETLSTTRRTRELERAFNQNTPVWLKPDKLLLPLDCVDSGELAILVDGIDELVMEKGSKQWLKETCSAITEQFLETRNTFLEPLTSLASANSIKDYLKRIALQGDLHLVLAESLSPARSVKESFRHTAESGRLLQEFNRFSFPLFHLGQSVFCLVIGRREKAFVKSLCHSLTNFARNAGLRRIHIGFSSYNEERHRSEPPDRLAGILIDEAWKALQQAGRRGPYSFCDYQLQVNPELFPLRTISRATVRKLSYRWRDFSTFSLVYMKPDFVDRKTLDPLMKAHLDREIVVVDEDGYFIMRPGKKAASTEKWASILIGKVTEDQGERFSLSAGISSYPFRDYKKPEIARNCMKALLHGTFFGPGSSVIFDSLSLNVSGDAYFGESDLSAAVKEYRKGLELDPHDVNLLNSLGVAYALMNMTSAAFDAFNQVLEIEPHNFMALFNKGLGEKKLQVYGQAVNSFTRALKVFNSADEEEAGFLGELQFQLGVCQFRIGKYRECIEELKKWHDAKVGEQGATRCYRYIGISYFHLGELKDSAIWLQRALVANQADGEALSLLGTVYLKTGEGDDIALNLCAKSVELEPENTEYRIRYAQALAAADKFDQALDILFTCARSRKFKMSGWLEIARIYKWQGEWRLCERYLQKIFRSAHADSSILEQATELQTYLAERRA